MTMAMRWCLLYGRLRMNLHHGVNLRMRMRMIMRMVMSVVMRVALLMVVRNGIVMVMPTHAVFDAEFAVFATVAGHERRRRATFQINHPLFQQLKNLALKAEVRR